MAPPTSSAAAQSVSATAPAASSSRARPQGARKRAHVAADDAPYHAPASVSASAGGAGTKRAAGERAEGEPRTKRKRVEHVANSGAAANARRIDGDGRISLIDFTTLPTAALYKYLVQYDLVPEIYPSPLGTEDPPPPSSVLRPHGHGRRHASTASPGPSFPVTPANRPRRDPVNRRRSSRLVEEEREPAVMPVMADVADLHGLLAGIAQHHFREHSVREVDTLASFMCAVKAKGEC
ncbi:hypothetical protein BKA93DRAFT_730868 [Sparassis latifolia]|uniref:Histone deacetylase complex subunit SAP30 Sin3 binding domain-containing protein n=1 Tax=Sparassis crispa TaxID=139825 RepID=A0A401G975_9APHY|nr:predicted protein [Sparassis crispa]GBE78720.1 predicted protein [Sparassis crispa]